MSGAVLYFPYMPSCRQRRSAFYRLTSLIRGGGAGRNGDDDGDGSD
jgi:hypothetical protein